DWDRVMTINIRGSFLCYKYAAEQMVKQGRGGRIIGASSLAGKEGYPVLSAYCASKFAVKGLTQAAALELGRYGITVNAYAPGIIATPMSKRLCEVARHRLAGCPIKHIGQPEDVASPVSYPASKEVHFITGTSFSI
ncbi:hypothetical protein PAXINDRAFT_94240, partial [Paxillus involutus ATCC 200175]